MQLGRVDVMSIYLQDASSECAVQCREKKTKTHKKSDIEPKTERQTWWRNETHRYFPQGLKAPRCSVASGKERKRHFDLALNAPFAF